ncbi:MAG: helix-turn-helix domain-containing protein [bacterium]|nr:helix-turn-helix domain-containing protein [bacterium]
MIPAVLSVDETAERLSVHPQTIHAMIRRGELRAIRAGRRVLVPIQAIEDFVWGRPAAR